MYEATEFSRYKSGDISRFSPVIVRSGNDKNMREERDEVMEWE